MSDPRPMIAIDAAVTDAAPSDPAERRATRRRWPGSPATASAPSSSCCRCWSSSALFAWFPILRAVVMSVQDTNLVSDPTFVGLENFAARPAPTRCSGSPIAQHRSGSRSSRCVFGFPIPIILAVLMSEVRRRRGLYSALAYLPVVIPPVVSVLLWRFFFDARADGRVQHDPGLGRASGRCRGSRTPATAMPSIVIEATWAAAGATVIIYLAALARRPAGAVRRGRGRRRLDLAEDPAHHAAAAAGACCS